jgi:putative transposase
VLGVYRSGYYGWRARTRTAAGKRATQDAALVEQIKRVHREHRYYGSPRVHHELLAADVSVGRHRVARLMRAHGIRARRGKIKTRPRAAPVARRPEITDRVQRDFHADVENVLWFTDITQVRTREGWLFAAVILDAFNREVISYAVAPHETPKTAIRALSEAVQLRRPPPGCTIHSDRGYQGGFNRSSQHLDHGGVRWDAVVSNCRRCLRALGGSGRRIGHCARRCVHRAGRSRRGRCCGSSGGRSRRE